MTLETNNHIINASLDEHFCALAPRFSRVVLPRGQVIEAAGEKIKSIYFPESAVVSLTSALQEDRALDVALIGFEGLSGVSLVLGNPYALYTKIVRISGTALHLPADLFASALNGAPELRIRLLRYVEALRYQVGTAAAASAHMRLEVRLARTILMLNDRTEGGPIRVTHEGLAAMLGATRPAVSSCCMELQERALLRCARSRIEVLDREKLVTLSNGSYGNAEAHYWRLHSEVLNA